VAGKEGKIIKSVSGRAKGKPARGKFLISSMVEGQATKEKNPHRGKGTVPEAVTHKKNGTEWKGRWDVRL